MRKELETREEVKAETETQNQVSKGHLQQMRRKTVQVKNGLHLMNKGSIKNIRTAEEKYFLPFTKIPKRKYDEISSWSTFST